VSIVRHAPSPAEVRQAIEDSPLGDLVLLIPARTDDEFDWWMASRAALGLETFPCPRCQLTTGKTVMRLDAKVVGPFWWNCTACGARGTRYEIERIILENPEALGYVLDISS